MKTIILILVLCQSVWSFEILFPKRLKTSLNEAFLEDVLVNSYKRVKVDAKVTYIPEEEINKRILTGNYDAIGSKIAYPELLQHSNQIEPPLIKDYEVNLWKLKTHKPQKELRVGVIKGVMAYENAIENNKAKFGEVKYFNKYYQLLGSLESGEIDGILLSKLALEYNIPLDLKLNLELLEKNLYTTNLYHFINKKHKELDRKISRQFQKLDRKKKLDLMDYYFNVFIAKKIKD